MYSLQWRPKSNPSEIAMTRYHVGNGWARLDTYDTLTEAEAARKNWRRSCPSHDWKIETFHQKTADWRIEEQP